MLAEGSTSAKTDPEPSFDSQLALQRSQNAIGRTLDDFRFTDARGHTVHLSELMDRPLVISLIYTACYHTCPMTTRHLAGAVRTARDALGEGSFYVLTIGFDTPVDTPQAMASFARKQGIDARGWYFLSTDAETMAQLTRAVGFVYAPSPKGFDHLIQATLVGEDGVVYRQVYGEIVSTPQLVEPLKELVYGESTQGGLWSGLANRVRLYCVSYDPTTGAYYFDYSLFIGLGIGALIIGSVLGFLIREARRSRIT